MLTCPSYERGDTLASEVHKLSREQRDIIRGERHTVLSGLIVYGPIAALYVLSWVFVVVGPMGNVFPWLWSWLAWLPNYLIVGVVLGATLTLRLWVRNRLADFAWRYKRGTFPSQKPHTHGGMFDDVTAFGVTMGILLVFLLILRFVVLYAFAWIVAVPFEVGLWTEAREY